MAYNGEVLALAPCPALSGSHLLSHFILISRRYSLPLLLSIDLEGVKKKLQDCWHSCVSSQAGYRRVHHFCAVPCICKTQDCMQLEECVVCMLPQAAAGAIWAGKQPEYPRVGPRHLQRHVRHRATGGPGRAFPLHPVLHRSAPDAPHLVPARPPQSLNTSVPRPFLLNPSSLMSNPLPPLAKMLIVCGSV